MSEQTTQLKKDRFIERYLQTANISSSCEYADISRSGYYYWIKTDDEFRDRARDAEEKMLDMLESVAYKRAIDSSDTLLIFMLKSRRRNIYGDKLDVSADHTVKIEDHRQSIMDKLAAMKEREEQGKKIIDRGE